MAREMHSLISGDMDSHQMGEEDSHDMGQKNLKKGCILVDDIT